MSNRYTLEDLECQRRYEIALDTAAELVSLRNALKAARREIRRKDRALRAIRHELLLNRGTDQDPLSKIIDAALAKRGKAKR